MYTSSRETHPRKKVREILEQNRIWTKDEYCFEKCTRHQERHTRGTTLEKYLNKQNRYRNPYKRMLWITTSPSPRCALARRGNLRRHGYWGHEQQHTQSGCLPQKLFAWRYTNEQPCVYVSPHMLYLAAVKGCTSHLDLHAAGVPVWGPNLKHPRLRRLSWKLLWAFSWIVLWA